MYQMIKEAGLQLCKSALVTVYKLVKEQSHSHHVAKKYMADLPSVLHLKSLRIYEQDDLSCATSNL